MIRVERLRSDGSHERGDLNATDSGMVYIFPAEVPLSARRTGHGWYQHRVGYIVYECDLSWTVRNIGNRILRDLLDDRLDALATIAASEGFRITALGRPDRLVDMKLPVTLTIRERSRRYATLSSTSGKVFLFPERIAPRHRRVGAGCGEVFIGCVRRTARGWDIELESGDSAETVRDSRFDAVHELVSLHVTWHEQTAPPAAALTRAPEVDSETVFVGLANSDDPGLTLALETAIREHEASCFTAPPTFRPTPASTRPLQSLYA